MTNITIDTTDKNTQREPRSLLHLAGVEPPEPEDLREHRCERGDSYWEYDARGIPLCRVCDFCRDAKLSRYRPCILTGYTQADVDEPIEEEY